MAEQHTQSIRLVSYNTRHGLGLDDWDKLPKSHIVGFQEVPESKISKLNDQMRSNGYLLAGFAPAWTNKDGSSEGEVTYYHKESGLKKIQSKVIPIGRSIIESWIFGMDGCRSALYTSFYHSDLNIPFSFINAHLVLLGSLVFFWSINKRILQIKKIISETNSTSLPTVIFGDFNTSTLLPESKKLDDFLSRNGFNRQNINLATHQYYIQAGPFRFNIFKHQLDYIFAKNCSIQDSQSLESLNKSDHYPIMAKIIIPSTSK